MSFCGFGYKLGQIGFSEFLVGQVKEHGLSESGNTLLGIVVLDEFDIVIEDLESVLILGASVFLVVSSLELGELLLNIRRNLIIREFFSVVDVNN